MEHIARRIGGVASALSAAIGTIAWYRAKQDAQIHFDQAYLASLRLQELKDQMNGASGQKYSPDQLKEHFHEAFQQFYDHTAAGGWANLFGDASAIWAGISLLPLGYVAYREIRQAMQQRGQEQPTQTPSSPSQDH